MLHKISAWHRERNLGHRAFLKLMPAAETADRPTVPPKSNRAAGRAVGLRLAAAAIAMAAGIAAIVIAILLVRSTLG